MNDLDARKVIEELEQSEGIRDEFWRARERERRALYELRKIEREGVRIDLPRGNIEGKLKRLKIYSKYIESGWTDQSGLEEEEKEEEQVKDVAMEGDNG